MYLRQETLIRAVSEACNRVLLTDLYRAESPTEVWPRFSIFEEFLAPAELDLLMQYALEHQHQFRKSQVISSTGESRADFSHRRSLVLFSLGPFGQLIVDRLYSFLPQILRSLDHPVFSVSSVEAQMTGTNDGEYFRTHNDNSNGRVSTRELTFVFFFHREPKAFSGGELRLYATRYEKGRYIAGQAYVPITPAQNMTVFFPSHFMHEVAPVICESRSFADSRFTLNGWLHR